MLARRMNRVTASAIMELIKTTAAGDYISFASGLPDPSLFPLGPLKHLADEVLTDDGCAALQYGAAEGYAPLRDLVAVLLQRRGLEATPDHVLITSGSQQGIDLTARALLDPGDTVLLENPSYLAAVQAFDSYEAEFRIAPMDGDGMLSDALPELLPGVKLLYTLPNFQNPTGITMSLERRARLALAAARAGVAVLEDDAYHDLRYDGEDLPPVCALADNPWAVYSGTFSKSIAPGMRVGYVYGQPELIARLAQLKQITDLHSGSLTQRIVHRYCLEGHLEPGIHAFREAYRHRRDAMLTALAEHLSGIVRWTRPQGGMFIWATLPEGSDATALLQRALEKGVVFVPGANFHPAGGGENTLRLNFVSADAGRIHAGIRILAECIREVIREPLA